MATGRASEVSLFGGPRDLAGHGQQPAAQRAGGGDHGVGQPDQGGPAAQVAREAAITVQAALARNLPEGKCASAWSSRSRIASSTTAC